MRHGIILEMRCYCCQEDIEDDIVCEEFKGLCENCFEISMEAAYNDLPDNLDQIVNGSN